MSAHVEISLGNGNAHRHLYIHSLKPRKEGDPWRERDDVVNYEVTVTGGGGNYQNRATFYHRYGDSELSLVGEAVQALLGHLPRRSEGGLDLSVLEEM